jgi:hypothetical protein
MHAQSKFLPGMISLNIHPEQTAFRCGGFAGCTALLDFPKVWSILALLCALARSYHATQGFHSTLTAIL